MQHGPESNWHGEPRLAVGRLRELLDETLALVEAHMPEVNTAEKELAL